MKSNSWFAQHGFSWRTLPCLIMLMSSISPRCRSYSMPKIASLTIHHKNPSASAISALPGRLISRLRSKPRFLPKRLIKGKAQSDPHQEQDVRSDPTYTYAIYNTSSRRVGQTPGTSSSYLDYLDHLSGKNYKYQRRILPPEDQKRFWHRIVSKELRFVQFFVCLNNDIDCSKRIYPSFLSTFLETI